jgi:uncharacterized protein (DUF885 family)
MDTLRRARTELAQIDTTKLAGIDLVNHRSMKFYADITLEGYDRFKYGEPGYPRAYAVNQLDGTYNNIPDFLDTAHRVETAEDAEAYLSRLEAFATVLDQDTERSRRDASNGASAPDFILDTCIRQISLLRGVPAAQSMLATSVARRAAARGVAGDWAKRSTELVEKRVYPALDRQIAELQRQRQTADHDAGAWRLPDGEAYYDWGIRLFNTKAFSGDEIHRLGLGDHASRCSRGPRLEDRSRLLTEITAQGSDKQETRHGEQCSRLRQTVIRSSQTRGQSFD